MKMMVSDMDGTLLRHDGSISEFTYLMLHQAIDKGIEFVIASGRSYQEILPFIHKYDLKCSCICANGAQYYDSKGVLLQSHYLEKQDLDFIISILYPKNIAFLIYTTQGLFTLYEKQYVVDQYVYRHMKHYHTSYEVQLDYAIKRNSSCLSCVQISLEELHALGDIIKVEAFSPDMSIIQECIQLLSVKKDLSLLSSFKDNIEITHHHAKKGVILKNIVERMNINQEEVVVFGDGFNDLSMFTTFKYCFALDNAVDILKKHAYQMVESNEEDGVAKTIQRLLEGQLSLK